MPMRHVNLRAVVTVVLEDEVENVEERLQQLICHSRVGTVWIGYFAIQTKLGLVVFRPGLCPWPHQDYAAIYSSTTSFTDAAMNCANLHSTLALRNWGIPDG